MAKWQERFGKTLDAALCFLRELRNARLGALADAEGWMPLVLSFERLGKFLVNDRKANLSKAKIEICELAASGAARLKVHSDDAIPIELLVKLVIDGRNEEFHGGSAARRFTNQCLELGLQLEDGLTNFLNPMKLKYVMTPNPTCAELDLPLYHARRIMLENSFTWLPLRHMAKWIGLSDHAIAIYTIRDQERYASTIKTAIEARVGSNLSFTPLESFDEDQETSEIIEALKDRPVLVKAKKGDRLVGIVTSFDLL
jgi:CBS domain-containing protein